jgi:PAS domain S-box-containing protein
LQVFNVGIAFTSFVLAALVTERRRAQAALEHSALELEERVRHRTAELSAANDRLQREITERQQAEEELRKAGTRLAEAQQIAHIGSWEWDIVADSLTWSDEFFRMFDVDPRDFDGTYDAFLRLVHPDDRDHADGIVRQALRDRAPFTFVFRTVRPNGEERVLRSRGEVMVDGSGTPIRMVGTGQDITEQQHVEDALKRFIANASHELRTPLTTVWGYAEALAQNGRDLPPDVFDEFLATLGREGERARHLLDNLLDLSRAEQAPSVDHPQAVGVAEATRRVIGTISPPEGTSVEVLVPEDIVALADEESLGRVLINLLTNAYKYGGPHVRIEAGSQDGHAWIVVADDGPGVPDETIPALFEPFTRGPGAPGTGSGLGLAIARALVESFEGELRYEPGMPSGARFVMTLPVPAEGT